MSGAPLSVAFDEPNARGRARAINAL